MRTQICTDTWLKLVVSYDQFRGVVFLVRLMSGSVKKGDRVRFLQAGKRYDVLEVGIANPEDKAVDALRPGQVGSVHHKILYQADTTDT